MALVGCLTAACSQTSPAPGADAGPGTGADGATDPGLDGAVAGCDPASGDADCLLQLHDRVAGDCDAGLVAELVAAVDAWRGALPAWHAGRALFVTAGAGAAVAGSFNDWNAELVGTTQLCGGSLYTATIDVPTGHHQYKLVRDGVWFLDPLNWSFAYDAYAGNSDGKNSVLNTYDSGRGELVMPSEPLCSQALGNCRPLTVYLPPGYRAPSNREHSYPAIFMHDGQNIFDDSDCCFGHSGWEVNVMLDEEIDAGRVAPLLVVGFDHAGDQRIAEYGGELADAFMTFQVQTVQATANDLFRIDPDRVYTAGSSLGGLISYRLAYAYPDTYAGAASLSGSFWIGQETGDAMVDTVNAEGALNLALYLDHGGTLEDGGDNLASNIELRDALVDAGYPRSDSPDCTGAAGSPTLCYFHAVGAIHDEMAWRARAWRLFHFLVPATQP